MDLDIEFCRNTLVVFGPDSENVVNSLLNDDNNVDFNNVIRIPEQLDIGEIPIGEIPIEPQSIRDKNKAEVGYPSWYEWRHDNWGSIWNATNTEIVDANIVKFDTVFKPPVKIFEELCRKYPTHILALFYIDAGEAYDVLLHR